MKLIVNSLGKFIVVAVVTVLVLTVISATLLPGLRAFVSKSFFDETNYLEKGRLASAPILSCSVESVDVAIGEAVNLFENITAQSSSGANLLSQLSDDYAKAFSERSQVFVYKVNTDNTNTLMSAIDTSRPGKWVVFYLIKDGTESNILKVPFIVK